MILSKPQWQAQHIAVNSHRQLLLSSVSTFHESNRHLKQKPLKKVGLLVTLFSLVAASIAGSIISLQAYIFTLVGLGLGWILFGCAFIVSFYAGYLTLKSAELFSSSTYPKMAKKGLGQWASITSIIINFICLIGVALASAIFLKNTITQHLHNAFPAQANNFYFSEYMVTTVLIFGLMFPLSLCKRISGIKVLSFLTLLFTLIFLIISLLSLFLYLPKTPSLENIVWFNIDLVAILEAFSLQLYPLMVQINLLPIMQDLYNPTLGRELKAFFFHHLTVAVSLGLIGTFGYILYAGGEGMNISDLKVSQNIFKSSYGEWLPVKIVAYVLLFITLVLCVSYLLPVKFMFLDILNKRKSKNCIWNFLAALTVCLILFGFTGLIESLSFTITLLTVTLYPVVSFIFPAILYCRGRREERGVKWPGNIIAGLLLLFSILLIVVGIYSLFN